MANLETTLASVKSLAQRLTENSQVLVPAHDNFPVAQYAMNYVTEIIPTNTEATDDVIASVEDHFENDNAEQPVMVEEENESQVGLISTAMGKIQYTVDNVVVPSIKSMITDFNSRQEVAVCADIRADVFKYNPIHSEPALTQHLESYRNFQGQSSYRTFILPSLTVEQIIELVAINNPHADREQVTEWLLKMDAEVIQMVYSFLFNRYNTFEYNDVPWFRASEFPFNVDAQLLAYFLVGHLSENIVDPVDGTSVTEEEWVHAMRNMHELFGQTLLRTYATRAENQQLGVLILQSSARRAIENRRLVVTLNGDVAPQWRAAGGDVSVALGYALDQGGPATIANLESRKDFYLEKFNTIYPLIAAAASDNAAVTRRQDMIESFIFVTDEAGLNEGRADVRQDVYVAMNALDPTEFENDYMAFARLMCNLYFPNPMYHTYLALMNEYGIQFPNADRRELATQSTFTMAAIWLAAQVTVQKYSPIIKAPEVVEVIEEPTGEEAAGEIEDAVTGEGSLVEETENLEV
jgi:hypothetical protein